MKKSLILLLVILAVECFAQDEFCGTDNALPERVVLNVLKNISRQSKSATAYNIPIVFHLVDQDGGTSVPDNLFDNLIQEVNALFAGAEYNNVNPLFQSIMSVGPNIQFYMPTTTCSGSTINPVSRHTANIIPVSSSPPIEGNLRQYGYVNKKYCINVWVVKNISGAGGYADFPWYSTPDRKGVVVSRYQHVGNNIFMVSAKLLAHELGHYLGLFHTWGQTDGLAAGIVHLCTDDDFIGDTPTQEGPFSGPVSCGSADNVDNIMNYGGTPLMFTIGQMAAMEGFKVNYYPHLGNGCIPSDPSCVDYVYNNQVLINGVLPLSNKNITTISNSLFSGSVVSISSDRTRILNSHIANGNIVHIKADPCAVSANRVASSDVAGNGLDYTSENKEAYFSVEHNHIVNTSKNKQSKLFDYAKIKVYPNPNNGVFSVEIKGYVELELVSIFGETIFNKKGSEVNYTFDLSNYAKGVYLLKTKIDSELNVQKVIYQ